MVGNQTVECKDSCNADGPEGRKEAYISLLFQNHSGRCQTDTVVRVECISNLVEHVGPVALQENCTHMYTRLDDLCCNVQ
jgi:hypothetical protein